MEIRNVRNSIGVLLVQERTETPCTLQRTLALELPFARVRVVNSFKRALELSQREDLNLILTQREIHGVTCVPFLRRIAEFNENRPVLVFGDQTQEVDRIQLVLNGAWGYLDTENDTAGEALAKVLSGGRFITKQTSNALSDYIRYQADRSLGDRLSNREFKVCQELKEGKSVAEVAEAMQISEKTVRTYKRRAMLKLQTKKFGEIC